MASNALNRDHSMLSERVAGTRASLHLDLVRGLAALAVLLFHVRYRFFLDYSEVPAPGVLAKTWYLLTSFGHDAVMVFFVLSGFLVGGAVVRARRTGRWNLRQYATSRIVRLYVVLIPALLLTLFWDRLGLYAFGGNPIYTGAAASYRHDFFSVASRAGTGSLLGNLFFLQGVSVPPFGSNDALWSLAFEGWYYLVFPLLVIPFAASSSPRLRLGAVLAVAVVSWFVGPTITKYFATWLFGVVVAMMPASRFLSRRATYWITAAGLAVSSWVAMTHLHAIRVALGDSLLVIDSSVAAAFALWLYVCAHDDAPAHDNPYARIARGLAGFSFTLYAVHLPVLVFLRAWLVPGTPWTPSADVIALGLALAAVAALYAYGIASVTEAHTERVRRWALAGARVRPARSFAPAVDGTPHRESVHGR